MKGTIWIGCARIKTTQVQALAQGKLCLQLHTSRPLILAFLDCKTDVYFNTLSLLFPLIGHQLDLWWLDPVGAALLSLFIIYDWAETCMENVTRLSGSAASERLLKKITYMAWRFAPVVSGYKTITAYHAGDGIWVEMDIILDKETKLSQAHDIAETLQYCLEGGYLISKLIVASLLTSLAGLNDVDRAFVSVDCKLHASQTLLSSN